MYKLIKNFFRFLNGEKNAGKNIDSSFSKLELGGERLVKCRVQEMN